MSQKSLFYLFVIMLIGLITACGGQPAPAAPSLQPPPTAKPLPPTPANPPPPTAVPPTEPAPTPTKSALSSADLYSDLVFVPDPGVRVRLAVEPNAAMAEDGTVYLFYNDKSESDVGRRVVAATADGLTFGAPTPIPPGGPHPYDPWRVQLPDGSWRKYLFDMQSQAVISFSSQDGVQFRQDEGIRYQLAAADNGTFGVHDEYVDPAGGVVMLYIGDMGGVNNIRLAYSPAEDNGFNFILENTNPLNDADKGGGSNSFVDPRTIALPDGRRRLLVMSQGEGAAPPARPQGAIFSFITEDGHTFTQEPGARLTFSDFTEFEVVSLNDPAMVRLADGRYRIYVAALIKQENGDYEWGIISAATQSGETAVSPAPEPTAEPAAPLITAETFTPCAEPDFNVGQEMQAASKYGPWATRLMLAFSDNGRTFTRANQILFNHADVPNAITTPDGEIRVFFVAFCPAQMFNQLAVAVSRDAVSWTYYRATVNGLETRQPAPVDPTVVMTEDGRYRLYFTSAPPGAGSAPRTYSAISTDGLTFDLEGERFAVEGQPVLDPNLLKIGDTWHYFAGGLPQTNYHAISTDGLTFTRMDDIWLENFMFANGYPMPDGYRYYGFVQELGALTMYAAFSADGESWTLDAEPLLEVDESSGLESVALKDPAITQLPDGRYLLIYGTIIPGFPEGGQ